MGIAGWSQTVGGVNSLSAVVVGGGFAGRLVLDALTSSDRYSPAAVADPSPAARSALESAYPQIEVFADHTEMFGAVRADVVCVSTPPAIHEPVVMDALRLPIRGILVEKPLGHAVASGRRLLEAIIARDIPVVVPHGLAVQATALEVIDRVRTGEIGGVELVEVRTSGWDILSAGIHWFHFCLRLLAPDPVDHVMSIAESSTRTVRDGLRVETTAVTYVETVAGSRIVLISGDDVKMSGQARLASFRVIGSHGQISFSGFEEGFTIQNAAHPEGTRLDPPPAPGSGHRLIIEKLAEEIGEGRPDFTLASESLAALEVCEAAYLSSRHRCKVRFPLEGFAPPPATDWDPGQRYGETSGGRDGRSL